MDVRRWWKSQEVKSLQACRRVLLTVAEWAQSLAYVYTR
jgi:hypothetical protein